MSQTMSQTMSKTKHITFSPADELVIEKLRGLSPEQKVGQMLVAGFPGARLEPEVLAMLRHCHLGGVMLGQDNIVNPAQVAELTASLRRVSLADSDLSCLVTVDQEGGVVNRLVSPMTEMPGPMALAATRSDEDVHDWAFALGREMRAVGIDVDYAPVLDVNSEPSNPVIGVRSFGDCPDLVAKMGAISIRALQESGVIAAAKHFPGHGGATVDSHLDLPIISRDLEQLKAVDLPPFQAAIDNGVGMVMSAHAIYPALTEEPLPATVSRGIMTRLLRGVMGFQGLVITDALVMRAMAERYSLGEAAILAVQAGADLVLTLCTLEEQKEVFGCLLRAVRDGVIAESRLDSSVARIIGLKLAIEVRRMATKHDESEISIWPVTEHQALAQRLARQSITLLRNHDSLLPLRLEENQRLGVLEFAPARFSPVENNVCGDSSLCSLLAQRHRNLSYQRLAMDPDDEYADLGDFVRDCDVLLVVTRNAHILSRQAALVRSILQSGKPALVLAARNPYDIVAFPSVRTYLATYGDVSASLMATLDLLFGAYEPRGQLPVSIADLFPLGYGLDRF